MDVVGVIWREEEEEDEEDEEDEDEDEDEEDEDEMGELTLTMLGLLPRMDSSGREMAEMSAAVVSTGTENVSSTSYSEGSKGSKPIGISGTWAPKMSET